MNIHKDRSGRRRARLCVLLSLNLLAAGCATAPAVKPETTAQEVNQQTVQQSLARGDNALRAGKLDQALLEYLRALEADPKNVEALYKIGTLNSTRGNLEVAATSYRRALEFDSKHAGAREGLGVVLLRERRYSEAKQELTAAVTADPGRWQAHNGLGVILDLEGNHANAQQHYQTALQSKPTSVMVLNNLGYNRYLADDWQTAIVYFKRALANDPDHEKAWSNLGLVYARQGQYAEAVHAFSQIMERPQALNNVGYLCMIDGRREQAEGFFAEAIRESPSYYALAYENLAQLRAGGRALDHGMHGMDGHGF